MIRLRTDRDEAATFKKQYLELLESGDWNCYKSNEEEHLYLKKNIGYALFGPPIVNNVLGYTEEQTKNIYETYRVMCTNHYLRNTGELHILIIFMCFENNDKGDEKIPVFVLKKCVERSNPCTILIDHHGRAHDGWNEYLENNKLAPCFVLCGKNGRNNLNEERNEEVDMVSEDNKSPAPSLPQALLKLFKAIAQNPLHGSGLVDLPSSSTAGPASLAAAIKDVGVGFISVFTSDQNSGDQNVIRNTTQTTPVNTGSPTTKFYEKWTNKNNITLMDVFQLSSSLLFFEMIVMNFRTRNAITQKSQTREISKKAQRNGDVASNTEIISGIQYIENPHEYLAEFIDINKNMSIIDSFIDWWNNETTHFYSIPNEYININEKEKKCYQCNTCQGSYFKE